MQYKVATVSALGLAAMAAGTHAALVSVGFSGGLTPEVVDASLVANDLVAGYSGYSASDIRSNFQDGAAFPGGVSTPALALKYSDAGAKLTQPRADLAEAVANNRYVSYTLDASGQSIDLSSLSLDYISSTSGIAVNLDVLVDSDSNGFDTGDKVDTTKAGPGSANNVTPFTWDLSSVAASTSPIEVRIYFHTTASTGSHDFGLDNIVIDGTVVPEPGSLALLGLGGLLVASRRRRAGSH